MDKTLDATQYTKEYYHKPSLNLRIKAVVIDAVVVVGLMYLTSILINLVDLQSDLVRAVCLGMILLYEPILTSLLGATLGQKMMGLEVSQFHSLIKENKPKKINFGFSILRYASKFLFGWFSLLTIHSNTYGQALHDMVGSSIVRFKK